MAKTFTIEIVTPEKKVYTGTIEGVVAVGTEGSFGVLHGHAPFISELQAGILEITEENKKKVRFGLDGGFFEIIGNNAVVLTDTCVTKKEVDLEKVRGEKNAAEEALKREGTVSEKERAQAAIKRADVWIKLASEK
ncbi:MAG: ATP synthase F1 subunit epsilon [Candidatus Brocadiaceae bacterium]|nr:ATP synthase F1 subunit epsilon [Candidatus Brocadiaceae bacterium]